MVTIWFNMIFLIDMVTYQTLLTKINKEMWSILPIVGQVIWILLKTMLKIQTVLAVFWLKKDMIYQKTQVIFQMLTTIINKEMSFQLGKDIIHKGKLSSKIMLCNQETESTQLCLVNKNTTYLKTLVTYQPLTTIINKEMLFQLDKGIIHKGKLSSKIMQCNQETESTQSCSVNKNTIYQKTQEIFQMLITTTNNVTWSQQVKDTIHKDKLISKIMQCNPETENIQWCLTNKQNNTNTNIINTTTKTFIMKKKFKLKLKIKMKIKLKKKKKNKNNQKLSKKLLKLKKNKLK